VNSAAIDFETQQHLAEFRKVSSILLSKIEVRIGRWLRRNASFRIEIAPNVFNHVLPGFDSKPLQKTT